MASWLRYLFMKVGDSVATGLKSYRSGQISGKEFQNRMWKDIFHERMTFYKTIKGEEMEPTFSSEGETLLIRKLPSPDSRSVFIGDVVFFKDPLDPEQERVRRVAAMEGDEMVSSAVDDLPFALEEGTCWVLCDNTAVNPSICGDSRTFGPLPMENIVGRVVYASRTTLDHGSVKNSEEAMDCDSPVISVELDVNELSENTKT